MDQFIIGHLSDLHCDGSSKWKTGFNNVINCLVQEKPNLIVITGDSVDSPTRANFDSLAVALSTLYSKIAASREELYSVIIPGNHDIYPFGLAVSNREKLYNRYLNRLLYPHGMDINELLNKLVLKYNIAIYPFDSTKVRPMSFALAQGRIDNPSETFSNYSEKYRAVFEKEELLPDIKLKIALLHHHPLPLPTRRQEEKIESFMLLRNSHQFLDECVKNEVDLILHGHKHVSGGAEYKSKSKQDHSIRISSCASSAHTGEHLKEIKIYRVSPFGAILSTTYTANDNQIHFEEVRTVEIIPYAERRKIRARNPDFFCNPMYSNDSIREINTKAKTVRILDSSVHSLGGDSLVDLSVDGIRWNDKTEPNERIYREKVVADIGRIPYVYQYLGEDPHSSGTNKRFVVNPNKKELITGVMPEQFMLEINSPQFMSHTNEYFANIHYPVLGCYCLTEADHKSLYKQFNSGAREEFCYINHDVPTKNLELIVKFPSEELFPSQIYLDAIYTKSIVNTELFPILNKKYHVCSEEMEFIGPKKCIRVNRSHLEVCVKIRHPQPDLTYILRWAVPRLQQGKTVVSAAHLSVANGIKNELLNKNSPYLQNFYSAVHSRLNSGDLPVEVFVLGLDANDSSGVKTLKVVAGPDYCTSASFFASRGVAGRAFRSKRVHYYEKFIGDIPLNGPQPVIEKVCPSFDPYAALSLPIVYPFKRRQVPEDENYSLSQPVGILSIVLLQPSDEFSIFRYDRETKPADVSRKLDAIYNLINTSLTEAFSTIMG